MNTFVNLLKYLIDQKYALFKKSIKIISIFLLEIVSLTEHVHLIFKKKFLIIFKKRILKIQKIVCWPVMQPAMGLTKLIKEKGKHAQELA